MPRIASIDSFERPSNIREINKKYFFVLEGTSTEVDYVKAIISMKRTNSHIFYFYRNKKDQGSSNLLNLTNSIIDVIEGKKELELMYDNLIDIVWDIYSSNNIVVSKTKIKSKIESYAASINKNLHDEIGIKEIPKLINKLDTSIENKIENLIVEEDLIELIKKQSTYFPQVDEIIIIGDRDKKSFTQYEEVLEKTDEKKINLIISNPCIEFWFLLHFTDAQSINVNDWLLSDKASKLVYDELKKYDEHYGKTTANCKAYLKKTNIALENSKLYCNDLKDLKDKIGTNMKDLFKLVNEM